MSDCPVDHTLPKWRGKRGEDYQRRSKTLPRGTIPGSRPSSEATAMALKAWQELEREIGAYVGDYEKVREALDRLGEEKLSAEAVRAARELVIDVLKPHERLLKQELTDWMQEHLT